MSKLLTLEQWARETYGDHLPGIDTLRRWARESRIFPPAEKHGRTFFVQPTAIYIDPTKPIARSAPAKPRRGSLAERIIEERGRGKTA